LSARIEDERALSTFRVTSGVLWEQVDVKVMLIDSASSELVTLNPVGSLVWQAMAAKPETLSDLVEVVVNAFPELDPAQASADVEAFLEELLRLGFVSPSA
jgi:Coenzyme PQQ synthesis protein D (PqqD)